MDFLCTIEGTNREKSMRCCIQMSKNNSKPQNCMKTRRYWAKRLFIQVPLTPNRVESEDISQAPKIAVPQCYITIQVGYSQVHC